MLRETYAAAAAGPQLPERIDSKGLLVGWSMEREHAKRSIGFEFGDACSRQSTKLVDPILFGAEGHLITIAATGAGKGIGCIMPALLTHDGPMIVVDPKGENAVVTSRYRREVLGQEVFVIDPMNIVEGPSAKLNPLDIVDPTDPNCVDEAAALADSLAAHQKKDGDSRYWTSRGIHLVSALILHAACSPDRTERTLAAVRDNLGLGISGGGDGVVPEAGNPLYTLLKGSPHPEVRRAAAAIRNLADVTLGSIISMAQDLVDFVRGEPVREATSSSSFSLEAVTRGDPMTIYIVLPPHMLESHAPLLRLWISTLLKAIMRRRHKTPKSTMLILDEAAQLGEFPPLRQAITLLRGYGLQTWSFWQDISQLKHSYPTSWQTIINNCQLVQAFGAPNMSAASSLAELFVLMRPEAILDLENEEMIVQIRGDDAFIARRPNYLSDPAFAGKFDDNPFYHDAPPALPDKAVKRLKNVYLREEEKRADRSDEEMISDLLRRFG